MENCSNRLLHGQLIVLRCGLLPLEQHKHLKLEADEWVLPQGIEIMAFWSDSMEHQTPRVVARLKCNTSGSRPKMQYAVDEGILYWLYPMTSLGGISPNESRRRLGLIEVELGRIKKLKACVKHGIDLGEMEQELVKSEIPARAYRSALQTLVVENGKQIPAEFLNTVPLRIARLIQPPRAYKRSAKPDRKEPAPPPLSRKRKREHIINDVKEFVAKKLNDPSISLTSLTKGQRTNQIEHLEKKMRELNGARRGKPCTDTACRNV